ncbi:hypothetical protein AFL01nite_15900 [Aeromicrobium flavum]|uniref:DUF559 domain-containing protein n=1 Tax=Aeromicrobium flavum TaxID=416568 RepID=A0A512HUZ1_9ACTN|nr:DUF559 domain-containing protein [Aeromicrobium flavum]GEO89263.1 hypothetical protein AFL01nite_15900 [Aeromicrobium flavum]
MDPTRAGLRTRHLREIGLDRKRQLNRADWVTTARGIHVPAYLLDEPDLPTVATAIAAMGDQGALGGWAALLCHGVPFFDGKTYGPRALVHCLPGSRLRPRPTIKPFQGLVHDDELVEVGGVRFATIARAGFDEMRMARGLEDAVVVADMTSSKLTPGGRTSLAAIERVVRSHHKVRGIVRATEALVLAHERSASPWETRLRLRAVRDVGLRELLVNVPVFDRFDHLLGIADLLDPSTGLVLESDGAQHRLIGQHREDNEREEEFEHAGLTVARFTAADHVDRWGLVGRIERARQRAARSVAPRRWTLEAPAWWSTWEPGRRYR